MDNYVGTEELLWRLAGEFSGFREDCPNHTDTQCDVCCDSGYIPKDIFSLLEILDNLDVFISRNRKGIRNVTVYTYWGGEYYGEGETLDLALCRAIANSVFNPDDDGIAEDVDDDEDDDAADS
jgi:hypothetical protein